MNERQKIELALCLLESIKYKAGSNEIAELIDEAIDKVKEAQFMELKL